MADRTIRLVLEARVQGLVSGLKTASQATKDFASRTEGYVTRNEQHINSLANTVGGLGLAMTAGFGYAVKTFMDFDSAMSDVQASTMATASDMELLRQAAIDAGADTVFSATEAAGAIENLARAGVSTKDILAGGLRGALDLAAAAGMDVAQAAEIAATTMTQFGKSGQDVSHIADVLAASAGKAQGDVSDFGLALKYVGPVASQLGVSLEETAGTLALLAQNGILADSAGTSLRGVMMSLTAPTKAASDTMAQYNIHAFDAQGNFVGLASLAGQLHTQLSGLSEAERSAALGRMFGNEQITAARILYAEGAAEVRSWTAAVDDQGYAAEQAAIRTDNLRGDLEALGGSFESVILSSSSAANELLRSITQSAEGVVDAFGRIPGPVLNLGTLLLGGGGVLALTVTGLAKTVIGLNNARLAAEGLNLTMGKAKVAAVGIGGALGVASLAISIWADSAARAEATTSAIADSLDEATGAVTRNTREVIANELTAQSGWWLFKKESAADSARTIGLGIDDLTDAILGNDDALRKVHEATTAYQGDITGLAEAADAAGVDSLDYANAQRTVGEELDRLTDRMGEAEVKNQDVATATGATKAAQEELAGSLRDGTLAYAEQTDAILDMITARNEASGVVLSERDAQREYEAALDGVTESLEKSAGVTDEMRDAQGNLTEQGKQLVAQYVAAGGALDITTAKGRENQAALDNIADANNRVVEAMHNNGASQEQIQAQVQRSRDDFLNLASSMGISAGDAQALADNLGLIPGNYTATVFADTDPAQAALDRFLAVARSQQIVIQARVNADPSYNPAHAPSMIARSTGGWIPGVPSLRDSVPLLAAPGEFVVNSTQAQKYGGVLEAINSGKFRGNSSVTTAPAHVVSSSNTTNSNNRTLAPTIVTNRPVTERTILNALHQADLLDYNR